MSALIENEGHLIPRMGLAESEEDIREWFDWFREYDNRSYFTKFEIEGRKDLIAFNLLNNLIPSNSDIVEGAAHDVIFLSVTLEDLIGKIVADDVRKLVGCGVHIGDYGLEMFV